MQGIVADGDCAAEEGDDATEAHEVSAQVGQVAQEAKQRDLLQHTARVMTLGKAAKQSCHDAYIVVRLWLQGRHFSAGL